MYIKCKSEPIDFSQQYFTIFHLLLEPSVNRGEREPSTMRFSVSNIVCVFTVTQLSASIRGQSDSADGGSEAGADVYRIEGKVMPPDNPAPDWLSVTTVTLDGGKRRAFLRDDHSFVFQASFDMEEVACEFSFSCIQGLTPGSYLVEVDNPEYVYEDVRIDINSKGKHRARKNNPVQPNQVVPY